MASAPARPRARRAAADIALQLVGRALNVALGIAVTLAIARRLGDRGFGQWSTIFAVVQITAYFGALGLEQVAVARAAADPEREAEWLGALVTLRLAISIPVTALTVVAMLLVAETDAMVAGGLLVCATLLGNAPAATRAVLQLRIANSVNVAVELVNGVLWGVAAITIAVLGGGLVELAGAFLATTAITIVLQVLVAARAGRFVLRGSRRLWRELATVGVPVGIGGVLVLAYARIDQVIVFELAGDRAAGLYGAVYRVLDRAQLVPDAFMMTLFPLIAAAHSVDLVRVRRLFGLALDYLLVMALPLLGFTIVAARPLVSLLFGSAFVGAASALPVLMGAFVLISIGYLLGNMIIVLDLQRRFIRYALAALVFNVAANLALVPSYGFEAAAWITLATEVLVGGLSARAVLSSLELRPALGRILRTSVAAALMAAVVAAARAAGVALGGLVAISAAVYIALALGLGAVDRREVVALLRREPL